MAMPPPQPTVPSCSILCPDDLSATWIPANYSSASKGFWMCCRVCNMNVGCKKGQSYVAYGSKPKTKHLCCQCPKGQVPNANSGCVPSPSPTAMPTPSPTAMPTPSPTAMQTPSPTDEPTPSPTNAPVRRPVDPPKPHF